MKLLKKYKNILLGIAIVAVFLWQSFEEYQFKNSSAASDTQNARLVSLYEAKQSDQFLTVSAKVTRLLADDTKGSKHQRFLIDVDGVSVLVAHNIDIAPRVPLRQGDLIVLHGEYEYTHKGGVLHWTHHDPSPNSGKPKGGWIELNGKRYE